MDIGKPERVIVVEPLLDPEPNLEPANSRQAAKLPRQPTRQAHNPAPEQQPDTAPAIKT